MGHPDGQNYAIWRGPDFFASASFPISASNPLNAQGLITNFASLVIACVALTSPGLSIQVIFYTDATATIQCANYTWSLSPGIVFDVTIPAKGNFVKVIITTTDASVVNIPVTILPSNNIVPRIVYEDNSNWTENVLFSIAASATVVLPLPYLCAGRGHVYCQDVASSGKISYTVAVTDIAGAVKANLIAVPQPLVIDFRDFQAPDQCIAMRITNNDAAASHTASVFMNCIDR